MVEKERSARGSCSLNEARNDGGLGWDSGSDEVLELRVCFKGRGYRMYLKISLERERKNRVMMTPGECVWNP